MWAPSPCPPGQYKATAGSNTACANCPAGYFCNDWGIQGPLDATRVCPGGYYCPASTNDYLQNLCKPGYYCPLGSTSMTACDTGSYCNDFGLSTPSGTCEAGYICITLATRPNPDDNGITGIQCPTGYYCPAGACPLGSLFPTCTVFQTGCPIGTYNDKTGTFSLSYCLNCPPNKQCHAVALSTPQTSCPAGFYCSTVNGIFIQTQCDAGYQCPSNQLAEQRCLPGTY